MSLQARKQRVAPDLLQALVKAAAVYQLDGDVQGVGLRKTLHSLLDELKSPGLAVNDARANQVYAHIPGNKKKQEQILNALRERLNQNRGKDRPLQEGVDYSIKPTNMRARLKDVSFSNQDLDNFIQKQYFTLMAARPQEENRQWITDRYRLQPDASGNLIGKLPALAHRQLYHGEPVYAGQLDPNWLKQVAAQEKKAENSNLAPQSTIKQPSPAKDFSVSFNQPAANLNAQPDYSKNIESLTEPWLKARNAEHQAKIKALKDSGNQVIHKNEINNKTLVGKAPPIDPYGWGTGAIRAAMPVAKTVLNRATTPIFHDTIKAFNPWLGHAWRILPNALGVGVSAPVGAAWLANLKNNVADSVDRELNRHTNDAFENLKLKQYNVNLNDKGSFTYAPTADWNAARNINKNVVQNTRDNFNTGVLKPIAQNATGLDKSSPLAKAHYEAAKNVAPNFLKQQIGYATTYGPPVSNNATVNKWVGRGMDVARSLTPLGLLQTIALHKYGDPKVEVNYPQELAWQVAKTPGIVNELRERKTPISQFYGNLSDEAAKTIGNEAGSVIVPRLRQQIISHAFNSKPQGKR